MEGDILIIDDVITAGTAIREAQEIIQNSGANPKVLLLHWIGKKKEMEIFLLYKKSRRFLELQC